MSNNKYTLYRYTHIKATAIFSAVFVLVGLIGVVQYAWALILQ